MIFWNAASELVMALDKVKKFVLVNLHFSNMLSFADGFLRGVMSKSM